MREHVPSGCAVVRSLDLQALEIIAKEALARATPIVRMHDEDPMGLHDHIAAEVSQLWQNINPAQIAYIVKKSSEDEWNDPDTIEYFYGMSVEDIMLDYVDSFIMETIEDIMMECLGPGEECHYFVSIHTFDDEVEAERIREMAQEFGPDADLNAYDEEEGEEVEIKKMLNNTVWPERNFVKGFVMEVTGENAAIYREDNGQERLAVPKILQLLHKIRKAVPGKWYEHKAGWKYRLVPEQVADTV